MKLQTCINVFAIVMLTSGHAAGAEVPRSVLETSGIQGGLVVHLGCGQGAPTANLRPDDRYLVHGLDRDPANVEAARRYLQSKGLYGPVSVDLLEGRRLPYVDNLVNLVVAEDLGDLPMAEVMRVLAPNGVACVRSVIGDRSSATGENMARSLNALGAEVIDVGADGGWVRFRKPRPREIDEWTHYLHDASNNAVAHDEVVAPLGRLQWIAGPRYARQHDHMSSISAMVSAAGRNFYIFDEAPRLSILTPPEWRLVARDAFNGAPLWKRPIERWHTHLWPLKSGPQMLPRRLVAEGDRVYVTLGIDAPVSALDAATGRTIRTFDQTRATEEILSADGALFLVVADSGQLRSDPNRSFSSVQEIIQLHTEQSWGPEPRTVMAVDADTAAVRWRKSSNVTPMTLALDAHGVYFHDGEKVVCLDRGDGTQRWVSRPIPLPAFLQSQGAVVLVVRDDVVLFAGGLADPRDRRGTGLCALSARDGTSLWNATQPFVWQTLRDVLVIDGVVWGGAVHSGSGPGLITGRDLHTGEVVKEFPTDVDIFWFHHRCYRAKATDNYLLYSRNGIEFVDYEKSHWITHHWVRGGCLYGIMPCNGLVYSPPHPCSCYSEAKLYGFNALAPAAGQSRNESPGSGAEDRTQRGPAYGSSFTGRSTPGSGLGTDWPTYRHDASRSGVTPSGVPADGLKSIWQSSLGGRLSSPTVAEGKVFVSSIDAHSVHALDQTTGRPVWSFTAGGRVDSPPTVWQERVLFGSADGYVYCLRAMDGQLVWRFRAAPDDLRLGAFDQIESVWPVHGSVLVENDTVYCVAGRSMFLDGGLRMLLLDPRTGRKISETILDDRDPATGENLQSHVTGLNMPVAMSDVLSSDGRYVFMRSLPFDLHGQRKFVGYVDVEDQRGDDVHLFSPTGFLDDTMWHRTYWVYGRAWASGAGGYYQAGQVVPTGRLLVFDDDKVYGYGRLPQYFRWTTPMEFHLFAMDKQPEVIRRQRTPPPAGLTQAERKAERKKAKAALGPPSRVAWRWRDHVPVQVCAMVMADKLLLVAGPPDTVDEEQAARSLNLPGTQQQLAEQEAAFAGRRGAILLAVSAADGKHQAAYRLPSPPVFDGMAAAAGRLYLSTMDGKVLCLGTGDGRPLPAAADVAATTRPEE